MTDENEVTMNLYDLNVKSGSNTRASFIQTLNQFGINITPGSLSVIVHNPEYSSGVLLEEKLSAASALEYGHKTEYWRIFYSNLLDIATEPYVRTFITADPNKTHRYNTNGYTSRIAKRLYNQYETIFSEYGSADSFVCYMKDFTENISNPFSEYTEKSFENRILDTLGYFRLDAVYEMYMLNNEDLINGFWEIVDYYLEQLGSTPTGQQISNSRLPSYYDTFIETVGKRDICEFYSFMFSRGTRGLGAFLPYEVDFFQKYLDHKIGTGMTLSRLDEEMLVATINSGFSDEEIGMKNFSDGFDDVIGIKTHKNVISAGRNILFRGLPINPNLANKNK